MTNQGSALEHVGSLDGKARVTDKGIKGDETKFTFDRRVFTVSAMSQRPSFDGCLPH